MRLTKGTRGLLLALGLAGAAGCADDLPTATGEDRFPQGALPVTVELVLPPEAILLDDTVFGGFAGVENASYLLVANDFDGVLDSHVLARLSGFPDSVTYTVDGASRTDTAFAYTAGRVVTTVDSTASFPREPTTLRLYALDQAWDSSAVSWELAVDRAGEETPWRVPGGTPGTLLAEATWVPGDTVSRDSVVWAVDSLTVERIAREDFPGLLVTSERPGSRLQLSRLALQTGIRPATKADTVLSRTLSAGPQTFVFTPDPPQDPGVYRVGGITGARTVLRLSLDHRVPACANPASTPDCPLVTLREVTLNQAVLLLDPVPVPSGFRPLTATSLRVRRVLEPELGRLAPLGETLALDTVSASRFQGGGAAEVGLNLTRALISLAETETATATVALLGDARTAQFGYAWFAERPRLRLVYTLPSRPRLP